MGDYWGEIRRFLVREGIKFTREKGHYDKFYGRYLIIVTIDDESLEKFLEFKEKKYFAAKKLVDFRYGDGGYY